MDTSTVFRFATLRNATDVVTTPAELTVEPTSPLVVALVAINQNSDTNENKRTAFNNALQAFISSPAFFRTVADLTAVLNKSGSDDFYNQLYDNVVARTITKSNNSQVFKQVLDQLKAEHVLRNATTYPGMLKRDVRILLPDGLIPTFIGSSPSTTQPPAAAPAPNPAVATFATYTSLRRLLDDAKSEGVLSIEPDGKVRVPNPQYSPINDALGSDSVPVAAAKAHADSQLAQLSTVAPDDQAGQAALRQAKAISQTIADAQAQGVTTIDRTQLVDGAKYAPVLQALGQPSLSVAAADKMIGATLQSVASNVFTALPKKRYAQIGNLIVLASDLLPAVAVPVPPLPIPPDITVFADGCYLKFPFQVADLRVVEQQTVGYLPAEIAHISNVQPGEQNTRVTRSLTRAEQFDSLTTDEEVSHETDSQTTEKWGLEKEAAKVQTEEQSLNVNASVSADYGPTLKASVDAGYTTSNSTTNSNSASQTYAKETVQKVTDRTSSSIKQERSLKSITEFEETVTHVVDNSKILAPQSYVFRWLNKLVRATLKNYGKRLIFQMDVAHPSHYYLSRSITKQATIDLPQNPRELDKALDKALKDLLAVAFKQDPSLATNAELGLYDLIVEDTYLALANLYEVTLDPPPAQRIVVSKSIISDDSSDSSIAYGISTRPIKSALISVPILSGYEATSGQILGDAFGGFLSIYEGASGLQRVWYSNLLPLASANYTMSAGKGAISFDFGAYSQADGTPKSAPADDTVSATTTVDIVVSGSKYAVALEIQCRRTPAAFRAWQVACFEKLVEGYQKLQSDKDAALSNFNPALPGLPPEKKQQLMRDELKKESLRRMFRCNPFGITDKYVVGTEYQSDCCLDASNAEKVRFLETVFDWNNMTFEFFPYFYGSRDVMDDKGNKISDNWDRIQQLTDDDPLFESFLQSSFATVHIPVFRDSAKERAAINFITNNSIANYEVVPRGLQSLVDELATEPAVPFTYGLDGQELDEPTTTVDLGIFPLPTSLVILECGTQNGVKPRPFPESQDPPTSDVVIPKQYSPAIIADTCPTPAPPTAALASDNPGRVPLATPSILG